MKGNESDAATVAEHLHWQRAGDFARFISCISPHPPPFAPNDRGGETNSKRPSSGPYPGRGNVQAGSGGPKGDDVDPAFGTLCLPVLVTRTRPWAPKS